MAVRTATGSKADWSAVSAAGPFTNIPECRTWRINPKAETKQYASSTTAGKKKRVGGTDDFDGSITVYVDDTNRFDGGSLGIVRGVTGWFKLYEDSGNFHIAQSYIDDVDYNADIEGGEILPATINFSGNGDWTPPT